MDGKVKEQRKHQQKNSGPKAERKKLKKQGGSTEEDARKRNPKAFAVQSAVRMAKTFHRAQDIKGKKHHIPLVDRTPLEPPPIVIVVVGPPKVGKSTLIRCLIKNFTRQKLGDICGPVTIVSGKKRRLTFMECSNDINTMIDLAKVADLCLPCRSAAMEPNRLSAGKRLTKPVLFGTLIVGLAAAFFNRHSFFTDVDELRAQERERNLLRKMEVLERRQRQMQELEEKKKGASS